MNEMKVIFFNRNVSKDTASIGHLYAGVNILEYETRKIKLNNLFCPEEGLLIRNI
jgi:hypothetical protein